MKVFRVIIYSAACVMLFIQCASSKFVPTISTFENEGGSYQYNDSTIVEAFKQNPQIKLPLKIAIYDVGFESISIADSLQKLAEVESVTHISPAMVEGGNYYNRLENSWYRYYNEPTVTDPKKLRTIAARSHSDAVLYFGTSHSIYSDTNLLGVSYFALVPMLFMKGNSLEVNSYLDVHLIDVRNGFIYTSFRAKASSIDRFVKMDYEKDYQRLKEKNIQMLTKSLLDELSRTLEVNNLMITGN